MHYVPLLAVLAALAVILFRDELILFHRRARVFGLMRAFYMGRTERRRPVFLSPAVLAYGAIRMDAAHGTPTLWEKIGALFGADGANQSAVLAGDQRDLSQAEQDLLGIFQPILHTLESESLSDLTDLTKTVLTGAEGGQVTTVAGAVALVKTAVQAEGGTVAQQVETLGETSLTTLVSAVLASLGKVSLPAA